LTSRYSCQVLTLDIVSLISYYGTIDLWFIKGRFKKARAILGRVINVFERRLDSYENYIQDYAKILWVIMGLKPTIALFQYYSGRKIKWIEGIGGARFEPL